MANILTTYKELKKKHPDAMLLFRSVDFYQLFNEDARNAAKVLGLRLAYFRNDPETATCVFPCYELDTNLPRLIRAGYRIAICDMPDPPKKLVRRGSTELTTDATENDNPSPITNNPSTNMKLNLSKTNNESANTVNNQTIEPIKVAAGSVPMSPEAFLAEREDIVDADFEEVNEEPIAEEKPNSTAQKYAEKMAQKKVTIKRKVTLKKKQAEPMSEEVKEEISAVSAISACDYPKVTFGTYKTKKGDTAPQIIGFAGEDDPRWKAHKDAGHKYVSASYRRDINGEKVYILLFGVRYMDVAKALCGAYNTADVNAWHRAEDACMAIYEQAQRDGKAKWEAKKQEWAEKKAERKAAQEQAKCYKPEDVAAMLKTMLDGGDLPEEIKKLMKAA